MTTICMTCAYPIIVVRKVDSKEANRVTEMQCQNCGTKQRVTLELISGPTRKFVPNRRNPNE